MIFIGKVSNGTIAVPPDAHLREGAEVEVRPMEETRRPRTGRELATRAWVRRSRLSPTEAESFAHDIEAARRNLPPLKSPDWS